MTMQAMVYDRTGPAREVLRPASLPTPEPGVGEVRVRLAWSGVNPSDVKARAGARTKTLPFPLVIPHSDGSGEIDAVGADVNPGRKGERVWVWNAAWGRPFGTAAEYVVLPQAQAVRMPNDVELDVGACLGIPALTAYHAVHVDGGVSDQTVLVAGGAGAVGHYAVQMAKLAGARRVLTTVSGEAKASLARAAGADVVINYKSDDVVGRVNDATGGEGVDRVIEVNFGVNSALDVQAVRRGGDIVVYGSDAAELSLAFVPLILKHVRLRFFIVYNLDLQARQEGLDAVTNMLERGQLIHNIYARAPLAELASAHELVETGAALGNVVVQI